MQYRPTIGLEVHAELSTKTKMFCDSRNDPDETRPNIHVCPICMAHPGTLPAINAEAVRQVLRLGSAVGGTLADFTEFDRKSYFYPDIPKGYQISQYAHPLVRGGTLAGVALTRVHLEEDTARSIHTEKGSLIDFNRAGVPLMELVTEPVIESAEAAGRFARELQLLLRTLGASNANLEKGEMRIEANISVAKHEAQSTKSETNHNIQNQKLGTKVEIKNLNSFRSVERAIAFEVERQIALIESGKEVVQETRGWDEAKQATFHQRFKEGSADYRYFPEPDLPKLYLSELAECSSSRIRDSLPELPWERRARYLGMGLTPEYTEMFLANDALGNLFEQTVALQPGASTLIASYIGSDIAGLIAKHGASGLDNISPEEFADILAQYMSDTLSSRGVKEILAEVFTHGGSMRDVSLKYAQQSDRDALLQIIDRVLAVHAKVAEEYRGGKETALQYLVGAAMKESRGAGNPQVLRELLAAKLNSKS